MNGYNDYTITPDNIDILNITNLKDGTEAVVETIDNSLNRAIEEVETDTGKKISKDIIFTNFSNMFDEVTNNLKVSELRDYVDNLIVNFDYKDFVLSHQDPCWNWDCYQ